VRGQIGVQFFEKRRRKAGGLGWFTSGGKAEEEICWEVWRLEVTLATPKTETGELGPGVPWRAGLEGDTDPVYRTERTKVTRAMEMTLQKTAMKIVGIVNLHKEHIPPITTSEMNPFPYQINLNPRIDKPIGMY